MSARARRWLAGLLVVMITILHHDGWLWDDPSLVANFLPIGLAYHAGFSIFATLVWVVVVYLVWPTEDQGDWGAQQ